MDRLSDNPDFLAWSSGPPSDAVRDEAQKPLTVSELTGRLKHLLERSFATVLVEGELSNFRPAGGRHLYFVVKDAGATLNCVMWSTDAARLKAMPREGEMVELRGRMAVYEPRGQYQLVVSSMRPAGVGRLFQAFVEMKERLEAEGLFETSRKRALPRFPRAIGVVTSPTGAAVRDILNILGRRAPQVPVFISPVRVQGEGAAGEIAGAIRRMNLSGLCDVLIVGRGGGSMEDLWCFNEEVVARAIFESAIPVISAVGHEVDFTIADFTADLRAPTPSAAAELVVPDGQEQLRELAHRIVRLKSALEGRLAFLGGTPHLRARAQAAIRARLARFDMARHAPARLQRAFLPRLELLRSFVRSFDANLGLVRPLQRVNERRQRLDDLDQRLMRDVRRRTEIAGNRLQRLSAQLTALNPRAVLRRGYSITIDPVTGRALRAAHEATAGQGLRVLLHDGNIDVHVDGAPPAGIGKAPSRPRRRGNQASTAIEWFGMECGDALEKDEE